MGIGNRLGMAYRSAPVLGRSRPGNRSVLKKTRVMGLAALLPPRTGALRPNANGGFYLDWTLLPPGDGGTPPMSGPSGLTVGDIAAPKDGGAPPP